MCLAPHLVCRSYFAMRGRLLLRYTIQGGAYVPEHLCSVPQIAGCVQDFCRRFVVHLVVTS